MDIREAAESDIPSIVILLRSSLGEDLIPKSERYWHWKHFENPFGRSPVLLCYENETIVGVRAFMRWEWRSKDKVYHALRAVDTATHPEHQGKGIFKKLTLSLVERCRNNGDHLVFNTPNQHSRPGYLKMGWEKGGRLPIRVGPVKPFSMLSNYIFNKPKPSLNEGNVQYFLSHPGLEHLLKIHSQQVKTIVTNVTPQYLTWRYLNVPVATYTAMGEEQGEHLRGLVIGRIKETRLGRELRITDCFFTNEINKKDFRRKFTAWKQFWDIDYVTLSGKLDKHVVKLFDLVSFRAPVGPMVTLRSLQLTNLEEFSKFKNWSPSIGDLELF